MGGGAADGENEELGGEETYADARYSPSVFSLCRVKTNVITALCRGNVVTYWLHMFKNKKGDTSESL